MGRIQCGFVSAGLLALVLALGACRGSDSLPGPDSRGRESEVQVLSVTSAGATPAKDEWADLSNGGRSNGDAYTVRYEVLEGPIENNEPFSLRVAIYNGDGTHTPASKVTLTPDAAMPQHQHGMIREPSVESHGQGRFTVRDMLFHMPGSWELYFDITRGAITERAQFDVELE